MNTKKLLFVTHRWLGVVLSLFMLLWFVSGLAIVYAPAANPTHAQQLAHGEALEPEVGWLSLGEAWGRSASQRVAKASAKQVGDTDIVEGRLVRMAGEPVWRVEDTRGQRHALSARDGGLRRIGPEAAQAIADAWLGEPAVAVAYRETFEKGAAVRNLESWAPVHRIAVDDLAGTELLVSAKTGEVLRVTDRYDRALFWAGNWLHLFRPLESLGWGEARRDVLLWVSGITVVATLTGLIVGWLRWRPGWFGRPTYAEGRTQPYRAFWFRWHFWAGLLGGIAAFLWIASGFLVNNPWQVFSPNAPSRDELARFQGRGLPAAVSQWRPSASGPDADRRVVEYAWRRLGDEAVLLVGKRDGTQQALGDTAILFSERTLVDAVRRIGGTAPVASVESQSSYDAYYYPRHGRGAERPLPVLRIELGDAAHTRYYLDPREGRLLLRQDDSRRVYRWLFSAVHHWDFGWLYARPLWDGWMLAWIAFGLVLSATSLVIGWQRLRRTFVRRREEELPLLASDAVK